MLHDSVVVILCINTVQQNIVVKQLNVTPRPVVQQSPILVLSCTYNYSADIAVDQSGKPGTIRESIQASGVHKAHYA